LAKQSIMGFGPPIQLLWGNFRPELRSKEPHLTFPIGKQAEITQTKTEQKRINFRLFSQVFFSS